MYQPSIHLLHVNFSEYCFFCFRLLKKMSLSTSRRNLRRCALLSSPNYTKLEEEYQELMACPEACQVVQEECQGASQELVAPQKVDQAVVDQPLRKLIKWITPCCAAPIHHTHIHIHTSLEPFTPALIRKPVAHVL